MAYHQKTKEELADELRKRDTVDAALNEADSRYAIKLVERIVFGLVALALIAIATLFINSALHPLEAVSPAVPATSTP
jgi:hypothetical protein